MATVPTVAAEFSQYRNAMYWKIWAGPDGFIRWNGYDDANWWDNVSHTDAARIRFGRETGRKFILDHETNEVAIEPADAALSSACGEQGRVTIGDAPVLSQAFLDATREQGK